MIGGDNILWVRRSHRFFWLPSKSNGHTGGRHWLWFYIVIGNGYDRDKYNRWRENYYKIKGM